MDTDVPFLRPTPPSADFVPSSNGTTADEGPVLRSLRRHLDSAPTAFAVVTGAAHKLVYANGAFRRLSAHSFVTVEGAGIGGSAEVGESVIGVLPADTWPEVLVLLDRVRGNGAAVHDVHVDAGSGSARPRDRCPWLCDAWPVVEGAGRSDYLVLSVRTPTFGEGTRVRYRENTERLVFSGLQREQAVAQRAEADRARAVFLADASRRISISIDQEKAYAAVAGVALPRPGSWCIVDIVERDGSWRRLAVVHPDAVKQELVHALDGHWSPAPGDPIGLPRIARSRRATLVGQDVDAVLVAAAHGVENLSVLRAVGAGAFLVVPLLADGRLCGAMTFVGPAGGPPYSDDDVRLAEDLAVRCALLLESARLYDNACLARADADAARILADAARKDAEHANRAKTVFVTGMSHELRTPLNAIIGYTELMEMGLRGPVTPEQLDALSRIRRAGAHLLGLINDVLNFARLKALRVRFSLADVPVAEVLDSAEAMIEPQALTKGLAFERVACDPALTVHGDREKILQVLLNLLSNAIKFTRRGGRLTLAAESPDPGLGTARQVAGETSRIESSVRFTVRDTGRGIAADELRTIFEPFIQVGRHLTGTDEGTGLGLAISRDLARGMGGDLTAASTLGVGSTFTLTLPAA